MPDLEIMHWVQDSHALARQYAYAIEENSVPSLAYEQTTQRLTQQQLVYAGCRLSLLLNHLASDHFHQSFDPSDMRIKAGNKNKLTPAEL